MIAHLKKSSLRRYLPAAITIVILLAIGAVIYGYSSSSTQQPPRPRFGDVGGPVPVVAVPAQIADVPVYLDGVGTARALNMVTVRPQVDGKLLSVNFREGQDVEKGFVLAKIDPVTYQAQYDQAVAKKAQNEALLINAKRDLDRYEKLAQTAAGPQQQADTQRSTVAQLEAQVKSDQAAVDSARATLDYTNIVAPIAGRTGLRQVDAGNIVKQSDATGIVVITQVRPIAVQFSLPQQNLTAVNKAFAAGPLPVDAIDTDNKGVVDRGQLQVVDNQVDQTTGTVKLKAEFPNTDLQLWPGQFINVRLLIDTLRNVVTVPTAAVQRGPTGTFVYVVQADNTVAVRNVSVTQQDDLRAVLGEGLQTGEKVVTTGFARLSNGSTVVVSAPGETPSPTARPAGNRKKGPRPDAAPKGQPKDVQ